MVGSCIGWLLAMPAYTPHLPPPTEGPTKPVLTPPGWPKVNGMLAKYRDKLMNVKRHYMKVFASRIAAIAHRHKACIIALEDLTKVSEIKEDGNTNVFVTLHPNRFL